MWSDALLMMVSILASFTLVSVLVWSKNRRRERESYYRHETYRKMMEVSGSGAQAVVDLMREEEAREARKRAEGLKFAGLILLAVGAGLMIFLGFLVPHQAVFLIGVIPLLIGVVMVAYGFLRARNSFPGTPPVP